MQNNLEKIAYELRVDILKMFYQSKTGHLAPALSCVDIFTVLYFGNIINWENRFQGNRDRVVLSKGHACAALYAVLARAGYFDRKELLTFYKKDSRLGGHPGTGLPGIECATGSLGHGICFATGTAKAAKIDGEEYRTYVIIGDGESQEGSVWEAAMFAGNQKLDNLIVIMDKNNLQASTTVSNISPIEPIIDKWVAFGWNTIIVDGHDYQDLRLTLENAKKANGKPTLIIANTVKGKGVSCAENNSDWHSRVPNDSEWQTVCQEFGITMEDLVRL